MWLNVQGIACLERDDLKMKVWFAWSSEHLGEQWMQPCKGLMEV